MSELRGWAARVMRRRGNCHFSIPSSGRLEELLYTAEPRIVGLVLEFLSKQREQRAPR